MSAVSADPPRPAPAGPGRREPGSDPHFVRLRALTSPARQAIFRHLLRVWPEAVVASDLAKSLQMRETAFSVHVGVLLRAGLLQQVDAPQAPLALRAHRAGVAEMLGGIVGDCCDGDPSRCLPLPAGGVHGR